MTDLVINQVQINPYENFSFGLRSKETQRQYPKILKIFLDFILSENYYDQNKERIDNSLEEKCIILYSMLKENPELVQQKIILFINRHKKRIEEGKIASGTLKNYVKVIKFFCDMNNVPSINWKIIYRGLPHVKQHSDDRVPTVEEITRLVEFEDRRIKVIVLTMISSGIRVGAWDYLKWKHVIPIQKESDTIIASKLIVYGGEKEEYYTFITTEAYSALQEWMNFRASFGENITGESWILRDIWQKTSIRYSHNIGMAKYPKQFKSIAVKTLIGRVLQIQGIRKTLDLKLGEKRHDFKTVHGFRKFFKTTCEKVMKSINVEMLLGHNIGISRSYYKPSENELLEDYLKAVDSLTINKINNNKHLEKEIDELREKNENNEYTIRAKLQEKDDAYIALSDQVMKLMEEVQQLKTTKFN
jgi:integrase